VSGPAPAPATLVGQTVGTLRDALLPSDREVAASELGKYDWRSNQPVVDALISAAQGDPAATVRAACVRSLVRMNANTVPVVAALQGLRSDSDPRVQQEVDQGLTVLGAGLKNAAAQGVQPASATAPSAPQQ
jgi:hypothetical protein